MIIDVKYKKQSSESYEDYYWRLCSNKELNIYELTWDEVGEILNYELGEDYSSSKWRKNYQVMTKGYEKARKENANSEDLIQELELKKIELKEEKVKISSLRQDLNKTIRNTARFEQWIDEVKEEIKKVKVVVPKYKGISDENYKKDYLTIIADIHTGKKGESLDNYYNLDVLQKRMWSLRDELIELVKDKKIKTLKILALGDLIDGLLRSSQLQNLQISRSKQTVFITRFLFEWLNSISEICYVDYYMTTSSNHSESRPLDSKRGEFKDDDYEIIIYEWLSDLCDKNPRIKLTGNDIVELDILGRQCIAMHGHQLDKIFGRKNMLADVSFYRGKQYQYMFVAHLHHTYIKTVGRNKLGNQEIIYCPCLCGNDDYSDSLYTGASPGSLFIEFNEKQGRRTTTDIILN